MLSQTTYVSRREPAFAGSTFARGRNTVRHTKRSIGVKSYTVIIALIVLGFSLFYVVANTRATSFDYEISAVESEISELTVQRDNLAAEKARLTSIAAAKNSAVAAVMEDSAVTGYATE